MAVLNLNSSLGTNNNDVLEGAGDLFVAGRGGSDTLTSTGDGLRVLAGGSGNDIITIEGGINIVIESAGGADTLNATGIDLESATVAVIDTRHLFIDDGTTQILIVNWLTDEGTIETFNFQGQTLSIDDLIDEFISLPGFTDLTFDDLAASLAINPDTIEDFDGSGVLTGAGLADSIDIFIELASQLETTASTTNFAGSDEGDVFVSQAGTAAETLDGGLGNDSLVGDDGFSTVRGEEGDDLLFSGDGDDFVTGGAGNDLAFAGFGNDQIFAGPGDEGDDIFVGEGGNDTIGGGIGDDFVIGGSQIGLNASSFASDDLAQDGVDVLFGGSGNDTLIGGSFEDLNGNGQFDLGEQVVTSTEFNTIFAGTGNDFIIGASGSDILGGGTGNDTLIGGSGDDTFFGGQGDGSAVGLNDVFEAGAGNDTVFGGGGDDSVDGGDGNDELFSGGGADTVFGGAGNDTIFGGGGDDFFTGGAGADTFAFFAGNANDTVTDFDLANDILDLQGTATDFASVSDVQAAASNAVQGGVAGLLIDTGSGDSVFLQGLSLSDFSNIDILF